MRASRGQVVQNLNVTEGLVSIKVGLVSNGPNVYVECLYGAFPLVPLPLHYLGGRIILELPLVAWLPQLAGCLGRRGRRVLWSGIRVWFTPQTRWDMCWSCMHVCCMCVS